MCRAKKPPKIDARPAAVVLGIMQDAGLPHAGCRCERCSAAYDNSKLADYAACLAIVDARNRPASVWLIDATPDIKHQLELLGDLLGPNPMAPERLRQPDGLFLTHAHMGHTAGLAQMGPEAMNVDDLPVYGPAGLIDGLSQMRLWQPLLKRLKLLPLDAGRPFPLGPDLALVPLAVPHRDEISSGTFAYQIEGPDRTLLYLPDLDDWHMWPQARSVLADNDVALVDASFYSSDELGGRPPVAHPLIPDTLSFFAGLTARLVLTHLNHTNPVLDTDSRERRLVEEAGAQIAATGQVFYL